MTYLEIFKELALVFKKNYRKLYLTGGSVRDYLLHKDPRDIDVVTDATPSDMKRFLPEADFSISMTGFVSYKYKGVQIDINTMTVKQGPYLKPRHPDKFIFVKSLKKDYLYRDFTINALYLDSDLNLYDFCNGQEDLANKFIRTVRDPFISTEENPMLILRALRGIVEFNFTIDSELIKAMKANAKLLLLVDASIVKAELNKLFYYNKEQTYTLCKDFGIDINNWIEVN